MSSGRMRGVGVGSVGLSVQQGSAGGVRYIHSPDFLRELPGLLRDHEWHCPTIPSLEPEIWHCLLTLAEKDAMEVDV